MIVIFITFVVFRARIPGKQINHEVYSQQIAIVVTRAMAFKVIKVIFFLCFRKV